MTTTTTTMTAMSLARKPTHRIRSAEVWSKGKPHQYSAIIHLNPRQRPPVHLVDDIWIQILLSLAMRDLLSIRQTCKLLCTLSHLRHVWHAKFVKSVLGKGLPFPGPNSSNTDLVRSIRPSCHQLSPVPLRDSSSAELEWRTLRALHVDSMWSHIGGSSGSAAFTRSCQVPLDSTVDGNSGHNISATTPAAPISQVLLLAGGTRLLLLQGIVLSCWSIPISSNATPPSNPGSTYLGQFTLPMHDENECECCVVRDAAVSPASAIINVAFGAKHLIHSPVAILRIRTDTPSGLEILQEIDSVPGLLVALHGDLLFTEIPATPYFSLPVGSDDGGVEVTNWKHTSHRECSSGRSTDRTNLLPRYSNIFRNDELLDVVFFDSHILLFWDTCVTVFPFPAPYKFPFPASKDVGGGRSSILEPVQAYQLSERLSRPITFSTCRADGVAGIIPDNESNSGIFKGRTLSFLARSHDLQTDIVHSIFFSIPRPTPSEQWGFPYRLTRLARLQNFVNSSDHDALMVCLGPSGRGLAVRKPCNNNTSSEIHWCAPLPTFSRMPYGYGAGACTFVAPVFPNWLGRSDCVNEVLRTAGAGHRSNTRVLAVDFDEGMGRIVIASRRTSSLSDTDISTLAAKVDVVVMDLA